MKLPLWTIYVGTVLALFIGFDYIPSSGSVPVERPITDPGKATLDFLLETMKVVTALNTALLSGVAIVAVKGKDWSTQWGRLEAVLVVLALCSVSTSYYGVYVADISILGMVYQGAIFPFETRLSIALKLQYYGTLLGVFALGLIFTRMLDARIETAPRRD